MSTYIKGYIPATDPLYVKHANVLKACFEAGIKELPEETAKYFGVKNPEPCMLEEILEVKIPVTEIFNDSRVHYEINIKDIPQGVEKIRFTNSW